MKEEHTTIRKPERKEWQIYDRDVLVETMARGTLTVVEAADIAMSMVNESFSEPDKMSIKANVGQQEEILHRSPDPLTPNLSHILFCWGGGVKTVFILTIASCRIHRFLATEITRRFGGGTVLCSCLV
jgi:hypothetical protein